MRQLDTAMVKSYAKSMGVNQNFQRRLNVAVIATMTGDEWIDRELFNLPTKDNNAGILFIELDGRLYGAPYELAVIRDALTGRSKPVICDFCKTWQAGGRAASISFRTKRRSFNSIGLLCCADLQCSLHVRNKTDAAKVSRSQLREDITTDDRVERLHQKLAAVVERLALSQLTQNENKAAAS